jgi:hypothetical protein
VFFEQQHGILPYTVVKFIPDNMTFEKAVKSSNQRLPLSAPALDPERMALTQPWRDYVSRGAILEMNAKFTPGGTQISVRLAQTIPVPEGIDRSSVPPGIAKQIIRSSGLFENQKAGGQKNPQKEQPFPTKSLCDRDFEEPHVKRLQHRIAEIASAIGGTAAAGRIGSLKLYFEGADNFKKWWGKAPLKSKVALLTNKKNFDLLTPDQIALIEENLPEQSPFRGAVPTPTEERDDEAPPQAEKSLVLAKKTNSGKTSSSSSRRGEV